MNRTNVVNLGQIRSLMVEWNKVRDLIAAGRVDSFQTILRHLDANETVFSVGAYTQDVDLSVRANLKLSAAKALGEDEPPLFQATSY